MDGSWTDFDGIWGASWGLSCTQVGTKIRRKKVPKRCPKNYENQVTRSCAGLIGEKVRRPLQIKILQYNIGEQTGDHYTHCWHKARWRICRERDMWVSMHRIICAHFVLQTGTFKQRIRGQKFVHVSWPHPSEHIKAYITSDTHIYKIQRPNQCHPQNEPRHPKIVPR